MDRQFGIFCKVLSLHTLVSRRAFQFRSKYLQRSRSLSVISRGSSIPGQPQFQHSCNNHLGSRVLDKENLSDQDSIDGDMDFLFCSRSLSSFIKPFISRDMSVLCDKSQGHRPLGLLALSSICLL
ncbi:hypothetical protein AVEN_188204-1 [Araneus ventricosus]|uniref:Uncharacterized protein n=1 Tax=Araneus ventricosus TaxID=182803 RepID=A0A4Y2KBL7_ARAVE|nr:hypothetical protein AVEN_188204-1 [Araneus ventricosus]